MKELYRIKSGAYKTSTHKARSMNFKIFVSRRKGKMAMNFAPVVLATCPYMRSGATSSMNCARIAVWNLLTLQTYQNEHIAERY